MSHLDFDYAAFGKNMKRYRNMAGLTQEQLAEKTGYSNSHIAQIENTNGKPSIQTVAAIANALGVGIDQLCYGELKNTDDYFLQELKLLTDGFTGKKKIMAIEMTKAMTEVLKNFGD